MFKLRNICVFSLIFLLLWGCSNSANVISPTYTLTPSPSLAPSSTPTKTLTPTPTITPTLRIPVVEGTDIPYPNEVITAKNISQITQLASWGYGVINDLVLSPDGAMLATATSSGVYLYNRQTLLLKYHFTTDLPATYLAFSSDSSTLAIGKQEGGISLLQVSGENYVHRVLKNNVPISTEMSNGVDIDYLSFSPDGQFLISNNQGYEWDDWITDIWSVSNGQLLMSIENVAPSMTAFSTDSTNLIVPKNNKVKFIKISDGSIAKELPAEEVYSVQLSPDGKILAAICGNEYQKPKQSYVLLYRTDDGLLLNSMGGVKLGFSPDNKTVAIDSGYGKVQLWQLSDDGTRFIKTLLVDGYGFFGRGYHRVPNLTFSPNGKLLALSLNDQTYLDINGTNESYSGSDMLLLFDVADGTLLQKIQVVSANDDPQGEAVDTSHDWYKPTIYYVLFSPDVETVLTIATWYGGELGNYAIRLWKVSNGSLQNTMKLEYTQDQSAIAFSYDGKTIASGGWDWRFPVLLRVVKDGKLIHTLTNNTGEPIETLLFSPDGKYLFGTHSYFPARIFWYLPTFEVISGEPFTPDMTTIKKYTVGAEVLTPDGNIRVRIYNSWWTGINFYTSEGSLIKRFHFNIPCWPCFRGVSFSPDGKLIAIGLPGNVQIWGIAP